MPHEAADLSIYAEGTEPLNTMLEAEFQAKLAPLVKKNFPALAAARQVVLVRPTPPGPDPDDIPF